MFKARKSQQPILDYSGGWMGVAAVPGSGKTAVLSTLAARLVATGLDSDQEVLIVTLVNSAVDNFAARIRQLIRTDYHLLPGMGYRVRTLHSLALDLVRERPGLVGLAEDFAVADEGECSRLLNDAVQSNLRAHAGLFDVYAKTDYANSLWHADTGRRIARPRLPRPLFARPKIASGRQISCAAATLVEPSRFPWPSSALTYMLTTSAA